eukprot:CAMPEP_0179430630 /NCGR_PEP_ID=MMETSP0799-20121207/15722_1 /TAXON_ID=46947 /ORGANISM="Geminigera cryophila, Strain CCMP2564" /LENGTH=214 /DNA_ID=CAMNT_0021207157 /DNA_START=326 /DNA_END=970 /DNA_ORIENTATION=-
MALTVAAKKKRQAARSVFNPVLRESGTEFGKFESRLLRKEGWVPGRIQMRDGSVFGVKFPYHEIRNVAFDRNLKSTLFTVHLKDHETMRCIVRELQIDPVDDDDLTHINLLKYEPEHNQTIIVEIPFAVINVDKSPGVKKGGMLNVVMPKVKVVCSGDTIPEVLELDIGGMDIGDRIFLRDLKVPAGVQLAPIDHYKRAALVTLQKTRISMGKV